MKVKICGLTQLEHIDYANILQPDYIGFVFAPNSRRYVTPEQAGRLRARLGQEIKAVGVFVNAPLSSLEQLLRNGVIDLIQLHGQENEDYLASLRSITDQEIMQAFSIKGAEDIPRALQSSADYLLLDNGSGGTGTAFDWTLLTEIERKYFLAGGLNAANVQQAMQQLHPYGVDTSSGVETGGTKDFVKMKQFIEMARKGLA